MIILGHEIKVPEAATSFAVKQEAGMATITWVEESTDFLDLEGEGWEIGTSKRGHEARNRVFRAACGLDNDWNDLAAPIDDYVTAFKKCISDNSLYIYGVPNKGWKLGLIQATPDDMDEYLQELASLVDELDGYEYARGCKEVAAYLKRIQSKGRKHVYLPPTSARLRKLVKLLDKVSICHPHLFLLSIYDHGGCVYSLYGEGIDDRWDTTHGGGVIVPTPATVKWAEDFAEKSGKDVREVLKPLARAALERLTSYENEGMFDIVTVTVTPKAVEYSVEGGYLADEVKAILESRL